jgi:glycosyltransferase involved in cell wall biosynthesis
MKSLFDRFASRPKASIIVIAYDMAREIPRTVASILPPYQRDISNADVEVIVLDNGSSRPVPESVVSSWPENVRYEYISDAKPSPASALNHGVRLARGEWVGLVIDGARMMSPGVVSQSLQISKLYPRPVVATLGYHLGPKPQQISTKEGYNQDVEDKLLDSIDWYNNGYKLFGCSSLGQSARAGWFGQIVESNAIFLSKRMYWECGGYNENFEIPGGGIVNLDFFKKLIENMNNEYVLLYGEGTFHQHHGGVTTSSSVLEKEKDNSGLNKWEKYTLEYKSIHGVEYDFPRRDPVLYGHHRNELMFSIEQMIDSIREARG